MIDFTDCHHITEGKRRERLNNLTVLKEDIVWSGIVWLTREQYFIGCRGHDDMTAVSGCPKENLQEEPPSGGMRSSGQTENGRDQS